MAMEIDLASQERILGDLGGRDECAEWRGKYCVLSAKKSTRKQELRLQGRTVIRAGHHGCPVIFAQIIYSCENSTSGSPDSISITIINIIYIIRNRPTPAHTHTHASATRLQHRKSNGKIRVSLRWQVRDNAEQVVFLKTDGNMQKRAP